MSADITFFCFVWNLDTQISSWTSSALPLWIYYDQKNKTVDISMKLLEYGWDKKYGGIFYMMDIKGLPNQQLEWDQKLWWVHQEAILAVLKGYLHTGDERCMVWFEKLHDYMLDELLTNIAS